MSVSTTKSEAPAGVASSDASQWFTDEVQIHDATLRRYLRRSFPTIQDVDDVVQESYVRIWRRQMGRPIIAVAGSVKASVKNFLFQIARHFAIDTLRRAQASPIIGVTDLAALSVTEDRPGSNEIACVRQEFELLLEAVETLPVRCREIVTLHKFQGLSPAEIATRLGISEETVRVQARRGLHRCQAFLRKRGVIRVCKP
ncbi:MAG: RNA polymerase sigma factor [Opitutaceae bacterium]